MVRQNQSLAVVNSQAESAPGQEHTLTVAEVVARSNKVKEVMEKVMKKDTHYGKIPGCPKPTLLQAGAQQLLCTFQLYADEEIIDKVDTENEFAVIIKVNLYHHGECWGAMIGSCSSLEEKYAWRKAICDEEFHSTPRRQKAA